jgi:hypothetical protein
MALVSSLLSLCPRVQKRGKSLVASTPWRLRVLTLGTILRQVTVDPKQQVVWLRRRYLWLFTPRRRIPFRSIEAITYGYQDVAASSVLSWAHDSADLYRVGLRLHGGDEVHLFFFYGDGQFTNDGPFPDWFYWEDYLFDLCGTQDRESRVFVELLSKLIGAPVDAPRL